MMKAYFGFQSRKRDRRRNVNYIKISKKNFMEELRNFTKIRFNRFLVEGGSRTFTNFYYTKIFGMKSLSSK